MNERTSTVVLAFDSFKQALSAPDACHAAAAGLRRVSGLGDIIECPLSDGGEGFADALLRAGGGHAETVTVSGPDFRPVLAQLVYLEAGSTAVIESAQACGIALPVLGRRTPCPLTSFGVGEMLLAALAGGARRLVVGLGGTASNDAGIGMLSALGWRFLDAMGRAVMPVGESLSRIVHIHPGPALPPGVEIIAACDVRNPLYGPHGAAAVFAPQKGATLREVRQLDAGMRHFARLVGDMFGSDYATQPGAGAAGGLGYALLAFLQARFQSGAQLAMSLSGLAGLLDTAAFCLTGEGRSDAQTAAGKLPAAVIACCTERGVPCIVLSGALQEGWQRLYQLGATAVLSISPRPQSLALAIAHAAPALADCAEAVGRMMRARLMPR